MHVKQAEVQLGSRIPWIADTMTNELKHALGNIPDSEFIIDPDGRVVARRAWSNPSQLRRDLERLIGPVKSPTLCRSSTWSPRRPCRRWPKASSPRVELPGRMATLRVEPMLDETDYPF